MRMVRRTLALGGAAVVALTLAGAGPGASGPPAAQLVVVPFPASIGGGAGLEVLPSEKAPAPARLVVYVPAGFGVDTSVAPGTPVGALFALYYTKSIPFDFASVTVKAGDPATLPGDPAAQACAAGMHAAFWTATFKVLKRSVTIRFYVDPTTGGETALGAFKLVSCLASPYVPFNQGGAPDGLRYDALGIDVSRKGGSIIANPGSGTFLWRMLVTPYTVGTATPNDAGAFEARARVLIPHVLTVHAHYLRKTKTVLVTGKLSALGQPRAGVPVFFFGGPGGVVYWGKVRTHAGGTYSLRKRVRPGKRAQTNEVDASVDATRGPCVEPPAAPAGCVDENLSPPISASVKVRIPKR